MAATAAFGYSQTPYWSYGFSGGSLTDAVGNDDLTNSGNSVTTTADRFATSGEAITLNGDVLEGGSYSPGSFSVSFWVKDAVNDATLRIMVDQFTDHGYSIRLENGLVKAVSRMAYYSGSSGWQPYWSGTITQTSSTNIGDGDWHHIVYTARKYGPSGSTYSYEYKLYIDGAQEASNVANVNTLPPAGHRGIDPAAIFRVGNNTSGSYPYENTIDDIDFTYGTVLSAQNVADLYNYAPCDPITQQPIAAVVCPGDNASFSVAATGNNLSYQWKIDGSPIAGATSSTLNLTNVESADLGSYTVDVTEDCGTVTSSAAALSFQAGAPEIMQQPADVSGCESDDVTIEVVVSGSGLSYQWYQDGNAISGATSSSYFFDGIESSDAGDYAVVITGGSCTVTSGIGVVTVNPIPSYSQQPTDQLGCLGDNATFTAVVNDATLTQWYKDGSPMAGELSTTLTLTGLSAGDVATYKLLAANSCGALYSDDAQLNIGGTTTITSQPQGVAQCGNTTATFTIGVTGTNISYQWQFNGQDISGQTFPNLLINGIDQADEGNYTCVVTGACGVVTSDVAVLTVNEATSITVQPADETICEGGNAIFTVVAAGSNLTFQWQLGGIDINGETSAMLNMVNVGPTLAGNYSVEVNGACGSATSNAAQLTINEEPAITTQPTAETVCEGGSVSLDVAATGSGLNYQWLLGGLDVNGETSSSIDLTNVALNQAGNYVVEVSGACGTVFSNSAQLTVTPATAIITQPSDATICAGDGVTFNVLATGDNLTFQWKKGGTPIAAAWSDSYAIGTATIWEAGDYTVLVSGTCGSETSSVAELTVNALPEPVITENMGVLETGVYDTYQWYLDGVALNGETASTVTVSAPGDYTLEVTLNGCTGESDPYTAMPVGIGEATAETVSVYPNPFSNEVTVELNSFDGQVEISVLDMTGRVVFTAIEGGTRAQLDLAQLSNGAYSLVVRGKHGKTAVGRLIKN